MIKISHYSNNIITVHIGKLVFEFHLSFKYEIGLEIAFPSLYGSNTLNMNPTKQLVVKFDKFVESSIDH